MRRCSKVEENATENSSAALHEPPLQDLAEARRANGDVQDRQNAVSCTVDATTRTWNEGPWGSRPTEPWIPGRHQKEFSGEVARREHADGTFVHSSACKVKAETSQAFIQEKKLCEQNGAHAMPHACSCRECPLQTCPEQCHDCGQASDLGKSFSGLTIGKCTSKSMSSAPNRRSPGQVFATEAQAPRPVCHVALSSDRTVAESNSQVVECPPWTDSDILFDYPSKCISSLNRSGKPMQSCADSFNTPSVAALECRGTTRFRQE